MSVLASMDSTYSIDDYTLSISLNLKLKQYENAVINNNTQMFVLQVNTQTVENKLPILKVLNKKGLNWSSVNLGIFENSYNWLWGKLCLKYMIPFSLSSSVYKSLYCQNLVHIFLCYWSSYQGQRLVTSFIEYNDKLNEISQIKVISSQIDMNGYSVKKFFTFSNMCYALGMKKYFNDSLICIAKYNINMNNFIILNCFKVKNKLADLSVITYRNQLFVFESFILKSSAENYLIVHTFDNTKKNNNNNKLMSQQIYAFPKLNYSCSISVKGGEIIIFDSCNYNHKMCSKYKHAIWTFNINNYSFYRNKFYLPVCGHYKVSLLNDESTDELIVYNYVKKFIKKTDCSFHQII